MIIAVDIDNVLNNLQEAVLSLFNKRNGTSYTLSDFHDYDIANDLPMDEATTMKKIYGESGLYSLVKPLPYAQDCLQKLVNDGHQVYLVTDAIPATFGEKVEWLHHYYPFIDNAHIISMAPKWLFKADILIEDKLSTLMRCYYSYRVCMNQPWNQNVNDWVHDIYRCNNWNDIMSTINKINERE